MDQSKALLKLTEAADLIGMIEDLTSPACIERLTPAGLAGLRLTLRNVRESILSSHDVLAGDLVSRARERTEETFRPRSEETMIVEGPIAPRGAMPIATENPVQIKRRDLRASIEKFS